MSAVPDRDSAPPQDNPTMFLRKKNPDAPSLPGEARPRPYFKPALIALGLVIVVAGGFSGPRSGEGVRGRKGAKEGGGKVVPGCTPPAAAGGADCATRSVFAVAGPRSSLLQQ